MGQSFLDLLKDFYEYCKKEEIMIDGEHRQTLEEFSCWLDVHTDSVAKEPEGDTLSGG